MKRTLLLISIVALIFQGCDKIDPPYLEKPVINDTTDTNTYVQKVLIEDFTGHRCGNCPRAHEALKALEDLYGSKIVGVSIHAGSFANPLPPSYPADYRTTSGSEIVTAFGVALYPIGMVNRTQYNSAVLVNHGDWASAAGPILSAQPSIGIRIQKSYNSSTGVLSTTIKGKYLQAVSGTLNLCVFLTEDSIVSGQTDYDLTPNLIPDYVHMHVLRGYITSTWGSEVSASEAAANDTIMRTYNYTLNSAWNASHVNIVAFIYNTTTNEVLQAEEVKLTE